MKEVQEKIGTSAPYICGGTPRDRYMKRLDNISDLDITTGDNTVQFLAQEFGAELAKKYNVTRRSHDDGHSSIFIGSFKMDFSSNFNVPNIVNILKARGIDNPTEMQKEMFSRDFTCNALLLSTDLKNVVDPTHQGFIDIQNKVIKTCLDPDVTLTSNKNRVIRAIYLASKLDFDIDQRIIDYVKANPQTVKISSEKALAEKLNEAFNRDADKAAYYITKMNLWKEIPITEVVRPYYMKNVSQKIAYFQGGGGVNEPTPGKKKYKSDPALVVQPRFEEPLYRNYDVYNVPGKYGPGAGWHDMQKYKSVQEFLEAKRKKLKGKYVADDSWQLDDGKRTKKNPNNVKARATLLSKIIKTADHMMPPKEHGTSIYDWKNSPYQGVPKAPKRHDSNNIDFPIDDQIGSNPIDFNEETVQPLWYLGPEGPPGDMSTFPNSPNLGDNTIYPHSVEMGGEATFPWPDFEGKTPVELDFGRDYSEGDMDSPEGLEHIEDLLSKYLAHGLYGLPDGVDLPEEDLGDPTDLNPDYGTIGPESLIYEDKWNI